MTAVAIWYEERTLWAVADTRISADGAEGSIIRTDLAPKLLPLRVTCRPIPSSSDSRSPITYQSTFGFAYSGDILPALMTYTTAMACLDNLSAVGTPSPPSLKEVSGMVGRLAVQFGSQVAESRNKYELPFSFCIFGWCPQDAKYQGAVFRQQRGELSFDVKMVPIQSTEAPIVIGSGAALFEAELRRLQSDGDEFHRTSQLPKIAMENIIKRGERKDVGGSLAIAGVTAEWFHLFRHVRPIMPNQAVAATFNGIDVESDLGTVGQYWIGLWGLA
jgi:hypothetical protein